MISYKNNFIFVHIPKCAGTSIEEYFTELENNPDPHELFLPSMSPAPDSYKEHALVFEVVQHYTLQSIKDILYSHGKSEFYDNAYKFVVVRSPWERMASSAAYLKNTPWGDYIPDCNTVGEGIKKLCEVQHIDNHRFDINQIDFLKVDGEIAVDYIIRFEDLDKGFKEVLEKLKLPTDKKLGHAMKSNHKNYIEYYTEETKEMIREKYKEDIEYFGYEFGDGK